MRASLLPRVPRRRVVELFAKGFTITQRIQPASVQWQRRRQLFPRHPLLAIEWQALQNPTTLAAEAVDGSTVKLLITRRKLKRRSRN
jgi:hypothetical protein